MKVISIDDSTIINTETVTTIGFFDGVHRGHRYLIAQLKKKAAEIGLPSSVITFSCHPQKVLQNDYPLQLLTPFDERIRQLASTGIDYCYVIRFTQAFSQITAENFIQQILSEQLKIKLLLIGYDHRFGKGRSHAFEHYRTFGKACGMLVDKADELPDCSDASFSSTTNRRLLKEGNAKKASGMLSYNYMLEGEVIHGNHLGRTIGFPTANIDVLEKEKLIPKEGVYAGKALIDEKKYAGMVYIGRRPTLSSQGEKRIEIHIFDFNEDIYGKTIQIELTDFIRDDMSFQSLEDLKRQLKRDKETIQSANR
jgi:riboflavin kinase/FMN adenylyltransferase